MKAIYRKRHEKSCQKTIFPNSFPFTIAMQVNTSNAMRGADVTNAGVRTRARLSSEFHSSKITSLPAMKR